MFDFGRYFLKLKLHPVVFSFLSVVYFPLCPWESVHSVQEDQRIGSLSEQFNQNIG